MFDELFPRSSSKFDTSALGAATWKQGLRDDLVGYMWSIALSSDELLKRCASFRGDGDLFVSYKFVNKFGGMRAEMATMNKTKVKDGIKQQEKAEWIGFLELRLTDLELEELDNWKPKPAEIWEVVDACIAGGYRFTLSYNNRSHLASCTMIDDNSSRRTGGYALSSSDGDGALALKMAVFKHLKLSGNWDILLSSDAPKGRRG